jgi:hypothetical protein
MMRKSPLGVGEPIVALLALNIANVRPTRTAKPIAPNRGHAARSFFDCPAAIS